MAPPNRKLDYLVRIADGNAVLEIIHMSCRIFDSNELRIAFKRAIHSFHDDSHKTGNRTKAGHTSSRVHGFRLAGHPRKHLNCL